MSLDLLREIYFFGNLDIVYNTRELKKMELEKLSELSELPEGINKDQSFIWRFYNNFDYIITSFETIIFKDEEKTKKFCDIFSNILKSYQKVFKMKKIHTIDSIEKNKDFFYVLVNLLVRKIHTKLSLYDRDKEYFYFKFSEFNTDKSFHFYLDYQIPYGHIKWTSSWKIISREKEIPILGIDIYLDSYFKNSNLYYNENMKDDLRLFYEKLKFLKDHSPCYLEILKKNLLNVTERLYHIFPYNKLYIDYKNLLKIDKTIYRNKLIRKDKNFSDNKWLFSLLPEFLSSYLLGFPIISLDVPGEKIINKYIQYMDQKETSKEYYEWFSNEFNKKYLNSIEFETEVGNGKDDEESLDLCYVKIKEYNQDDIVSIFNNNILHHFSCREFETILKKEENPYNRDKITNLRKVIDNLKFKKRIKKTLLTKGLDLELNGSMLENYEEVMEKIQDEESKINYSYTHNEIESFYRPLLDIFINQNINF